MNISNYLNNLVHASDLRSSRARQLRRYIHRAIWLEFDRDSSVTVEEILDHVHLALIDDLLAGEPGDASFESERGHRQPWFE